MDSGLYDEKGNMIRETYEDEDGNQHAIESTSKDRSKYYSYVEIRKTYNEQNKLIEQAYIDADGDPAKCAKQYSVQRYEYDPQGRQTLTAWFTVNDEPYVNDKGYVSMDREFLLRKDLSLKAKGLLAHMMTLPTAMAALPSGGAISQERNIPTPMVTRGVTRISTLDSLATTLPNSAAIIAMKRTASGPPAPPSALAAKPTAVMEKRTSGGHFSA